MANTTIDQLTSLTGTGVATNDLFLVYDASANIEKSITSAEMKNMVGNGALTITTSGTSDALIVTSTDANGTAAPDIVFYRDSASPAASDSIGNIVFRGKNSAAVAKDYAGIFTTITSPTSSSESGVLTFNTMSAGALAERMRINEFGNIGIGYAGSASVALGAAKPITGSVSGYGAYFSPTAQSDVTSTFTTYQSVPNTVASAFTLSNLYHFNASQGTVGAGSTITSQSGFYVSGALIGATNNYGFHAAASTAANVTTGKSVFGFNSNHPIATGGGTTWNFYAPGTAPNLFTGNVGVGAASTGSKLHVSGNTYISGAVSTASSILSAGAGGIGYATGAGGAVTQLTSRTTGVTLNKNAGAITLFTAAGSATAATFTVTNFTVAATDTIVLNQKSGTNLYILAVTAVAAGSFNVTFYTTGGTASDAPVINFAVIKAVAA